MGTLLLEGGAEFGGHMSEPDLRALALAGGLDTPVAILPTAAAPDHNSERAGRNALRWFSSLGASHTDVLPVVDRASASRPDLADRVRSARLIYMLGGFPGYLAATLQGSLVWQAALEAYRQGAVLGGSSAGAMVLCEHLYDPEAGRVVQGLGLLPNACVLPHHNTFGRGWAPRLALELPGASLIGIDEQTGILDDAAGAWNVYGAGRVTIYHAGGSRVSSRGEAFSLSVPPLSADE
jgi:cyanophycinase